ncbi:MAG: class I SAM-dependent methyltransferase [Lachnospiraceae bacterium]|nr:class I SAM-dependent methyltransferase [Lachnospiraceae bacterium]
MKLSERLKAVASMVTPDNGVADVGCDHGYLAIYLVEQGIAPFVYATDIGKGPIDHALVNITESGYGSRIKTVLSDGLKGLTPGSCETVVMAGMGGPLMMDIMKDSPEVLEKVSELVLQPQSEIAMVRHFLQDTGYRIISENMVWEDEKFYPVMKAVHGSMNWDREIYFRYGKILLKERNPVLLQFLYMQKKSLSYLLSELESKRDEIRCQSKEAGDPDDKSTERISDRIAEVKKDIMHNAEAISLMEEKNPVEIERVLS